MYEISSNTAVLMHRIFYKNKPKAARNKGFRTYVSKITIQF